MLMLALVRTPDQHDQAGVSDLPAQAIPQSDLLSSNLITPDSSQGSMLMLALVRTPDQHDQAGIS